MPTDHQPLFAAPVRSIETDERYTPAWVFAGMGLTFDLDPASPVDATTHVPARARFTRHDDGLAQPWHGLVWVNPPFSASSAWSDRFIAHGNGVFLGPIANAKWRRRLLDAADLVWLADDFAFDAPIHAGKRSSMPLLFAAMGPTATGGLARLAHSGRHPGTLVMVIRDTSPDVVHNV